MSGDYDRLWLDVDLTLLCWFSYPLGSLYRNVHEIKTKYRVKNRHSFFYLKWIWYDAIINKSKPKTQSLQILDFCNGKSWDKMLQICPKWLRVMEFIDKNKKKHSPDKKNHYIVHLDHVYLSFVLFIVYICTQFLFYELCKNVVGFCYFLCNI